MEELSYQPHCVDCWTEPNSAGKLCTNMTVFVPVLFVCKTRGRNQKQAIGSSWLQVIKFMEWNKCLQFEKPVSGLLTNLTFSSLRVSNWWLVNCLSTVRWNTNFLGKVQLKLFLSVGGLRIFLLFCLRMKRASDSPNHEASLFLQSGFISKPFFD